MPVDTSSSIAFELPHEVLERVFALGLSLHATKTRAERGDADRAELVERLARAIDDLDTIARHIRNSVWRSVTEARRAVDAPTTIDHEDHQKLSILVVDDDADMRALLATLLDDLGTVHAAPDVYQALDYLDGQLVDVVVLDLLLPGANGVVLLDRLAELDRAIPAVVVSGVGSDNRLSRLAQEAGARAILTKPFDGVLLRENVVAASRSSLI